ncbi:hypothetical protein [Hydrocarboniphaga sp.]|uniref:hypothetical protein n=1 Tax=Hydrocarboniphaga sp. TaxID=2033016 RepID=UPI003D0D13F1
MPRPPLLCLLLLSSLSMTGCHRIEAVETLPEASSPAPTVEGSKTSIERKPVLRPSRGEALSMCDAYMGFEKNDCLYKVKRDYDQVVASIGSSIAGWRHAS